MSLDPVRGDRFLEAIDDIAAAVEAAREALDESTEPLVSARRQRLAGTSMLEIVDDLVAAGGPASPAPPAPRPAASSSAPILRSR